MWKKLKLKPTSLVYINNPPVSFESYITEIDNKIYKKLSKSIDFILSFVTTKEDVKLECNNISKNKFEGDLVLWLCYPKQSSKLYPKCEITRDNGWEHLGNIGFEVVSLVAIDQDWSALRFRKVEHIKSMTRNVLGAMTSVGKEKATLSNSKRKSNIIEDKNDKENNKKIKK
jgi:hypothetical protein